MNFGIVTLHMVLKAIFSPIQAGCYCSFRAIEENGGFFENKIYSSGVESNTEITKEGSSNKVATVYLDLDKKVRKLHLYEPLYLTEYEPEQRYMRRDWIDGIRLSDSVAVMKRSYGSLIGNINIVWEVSSDDPNHETNMAKAVLVVTEDLTQYHTRKMRKDFLSKYLRLVKTSKAHLNEIYRELTGYHTAASSEQERLHREIAPFLACNDEDNMLTDLRKLNGKMGTSFTEFWVEVKKYSQNTKDLCRRGGMVHFYTYHL